MALVVAGSAGCTGRGGCDLGAPRFLHALTAIHAIGAVACFVMAAGSAASPEFRESLAMSGGSRIMVDTMGPFTSLFLFLVGTFLAVLALASYRRHPWAWAMTIGAYSFGVVGSLWQVSVGIPQGWVSAAINGAVVTYACTPGVRRAYLGPRQ